MKRFMAVTALVSVLGLGRISLAHESVVPDVRPVTSSSLRATAFDGDLARGSYYWVYYRMAGIGHPLVSYPFTNLRDAYSWADLIRREGAYAIEVSTRGPG